MDQFSDRNIKFNWLDIVKNYQDRKHHLFEIGNCDSTDDNEFLIKKMELKFQMWKGNQKQSP